MENIIKVLSYNIHAGIGMDGVLDLDRIVHIISSEGADIIGLNEVDSYTSRSEGVDQVKYIADKLGYYYVFGKTIDYRGGEYGNAFISKYPIINFRNHRLPIHSPDTRELRGMLECDVDIDGHMTKVLVAHLGLEKSERKLSIEYISDMLDDIDSTAILMGDFNLAYRGEFEELSLLMPHLKDTAEDIGVANDIMTFDSKNPNRKIDYILVSKDIKVMSTYTISSLASDHLPLICKLEL